MMEGIRLQKVLAQAGIASRRASEELMREGRVQVNGRVIKELGARVHPGKDEIKVDGAVISLEEAKIYLLFYKPKGCVTTHPLGL